MKNKTRNQKDYSLVWRYIENAYPSKDFFEEAILSGKKLTIYHGIDPTGPTLHLGHSTNLFLLKSLQKLGHKIFLLVGDFTARIGDPSGKTKERVPLSPKEIAKNIKLYKEQAGRIIDFKSKKNKAEIVFNNKWLSKLSLEELIELSSHFTVNQVIERDLFQKRLEAKKPISLLEFLYPLFQGYDSLALNTDIEIGGTDQLFNMLIGRDVMKIYKNKEKIVITTPLLINPKTNTKLMSKSEGSFIALNDKPNDMFGKAMALPDEVVGPCFRLCTMISDSDIDEIEKMAPRKAKEKLAYTLVEMYYDTKKANKASEYFDKTFVKKETPSEIPLFKVKKGDYPIADLLESSGVVSSKSEARRLVEQKAVEVNGKLINNWSLKITVSGDVVIKIGKHRFLKIIIDK